MIVDTFLQSVSYPAEAGQESDMDVTPSKRVLEFMSHRSQCSLIVYVTFLLTCSLESRCSLFAPLSPTSSLHITLQKIMAHYQFERTVRLNAAAGFDAHARPRTMSARTIGPHTGAAGSGITDLFECINDGRRR